MADNIDINVVVTGKEDLQSLSVAMRNLLLNTKEITTATKNMDARQRAINSMFGSGSKHAGDYAKSIRETVSNQKILGEEIRRTTDDIRRLNQMMKAGIGGPGIASLANNLQATNKALKSSKIRMMATDLRSVGIEMKRLGKDAQFVGRSLLIGITAPLMAFGRVGLQKFYALDKQLTRLKKLLNESSAGVGKLGEKTSQLADAATTLSYEFGIAKELIVGVSGDFAELGINTVKEIKNLTRLTTEFSILGDMDVSAAQELTQTLYLGSLNALEMTGRMKEFNSAADAQAYAVRNVTGQMYMFNAIENATALSMREIAQTLPEVSAAGQAFGLNFNEMMAILAPMKAVGIDVGAASTGIKTSLQKLVNPTIKMQKELAKLSDEAKKLGNVSLAEDFLGIQSIGISSIQSLVDVTLQLSKNASDEAVLSFYSKLFDDRQATRMLIAMKDLGRFQESMFRTSVEGVASAEKQFVDRLNEALVGTKFFVKDIQSLSEVTAIANLSFQQLNESGTVFVKSLGREVSKAEIQAAKDARKQLQDYAKEQMKDGKNLIEDMTSEAGKTLAVSFLGASGAMELAKRELQAAKDATSTSIDRIKIAFSNLSATFINDLAPVIRSIADAFQSFVEKVQNMSPQVRTLILTLLGVAASLGPLVFIFGQFKLGFGVILEGLMRLVPGLKTVAIESLTTTSKLLNLRKALTMQGDTVVNLNSRFSTFIATLASGNGRIAAITTRFGEMTGILKKTKTAAADVIGAIDQLTPRASKVMGQALAVSDVGTDLTPNLRSMTGDGGIKELLAKEKSAAMSSLGFAGAAGQKVSIPLRLDKSKIGKDMAAGSALMRNISKGMMASGFGLSADDVARFTITANGKVLDQNKKFASKEIADRFKNLVAFHQRKLGLDFESEKRSLENATQLAIDHAVKRNLAIDDANAKASKMARQKIRDDLKFKIDEAKAAEAKIAQQARRMPYYQKKGIEIGEDGGLLRRGRAISQERADILAGGGLRSVRERAKMAMETVAAKPVAIVKKVKEVAVSPVTRFKSSLDSARASIAALNAKNAEFGRSSPGFFSKATSGIGGFVKGIFSANKAFALLKTVMISSGIGILLLGFAAAVVIVVKNFDKIRTAAAPGIKMLQEAFTILKDVVKALIAPFLDMFAALGGADKGASKANNIATAFNKIASFVKKAAEMVQEFVNKYVVPFLYRALTAVMGVIGGIVKFIKGIIKLKDNWKEGLKMMLGALKQIGGAILGFFLGTVVRLLVMAVFEGVKLIIKLFFGMAKGVVNIWREMAKINIKIIFGLAEAGLKVVEYIILAFSYLPRGIGNAVEKAASIFADFVDGIAESVRGTPLLGWLAEKAGITGAAHSVANTLRGIGKTVGEAGRETADWMNRLLDEPKSALDSLKNSLLDGVDSVADTVNNLLDNVSDGVVGVVDGLGDSLANWLKGFGKNKIGKGAGKDFLDNVNEEVDDGIDEALDPVIDAGKDTGAEAGKEAGNEFKKAFEEALKDLMQKFVDLVLESLKSSIDEATDKLKTALEKQRDQALAVYDAQIDALEKLEKAEESLTREKEYQLNRRKMLDERELQRSNYLRNRALAIYEGRIDDARMLALEDQKDARDFTENITKLDEDRRRDLIRENIDYLKDAIKTAQEETSRLIEEQIAKFQEAAKEITKFPPLTIEEYTSQLNQLNDIATQVAGENGSILKGMMDSMYINLKMPNQNLGVFATGLDQLVLIAQDKYGLTGNKDKNSIVGATVAMLTGIQGQFIDNRSAISGAFSGIVDDVFNVASSLDNVSKDIVRPALDAIQKVITDYNPFTALEKAVKDANETILREMQKTVGHVASLVDNLTKLIAQSLIELTKAQVAAQQAGKETPATTTPSPAPAPTTGTPGTSGSTGKPPTATIKPAESIRTLVSRVVGSLTSGTADNRERMINQVIVEVRSVLNNLLKYPDPYSKVKDVIKYYQDTGLYNKWPWQGAAKVFGSGPTAVEAINLAKAGKFYTGGFVTPGVPSASVPAILHGGEFVVSSKAVSNIGMATLSALNNMRYMTPGGFRGGVGGGGGQPSGAGYSSSKTENINIYVENFIGEDEWFNSMLKKYNMNVLPRNQKAAGMENRVVTTYTGLSRGM